MGLYFNERDFTQEAFHSGIGGDAGVFGEVGPTVYAASHLQ